MTPRVRRRVALAATVAIGLVGAACGTPVESDASSQPQGATLRVRIGTQEFPEGRILGELWRQALAVNGYAVDLRKGIGPAQDLDDALAQGDIDGYVAYTGTVLSVVAGQDVSGLGPDETYDRARQFYAGQDMVMSGMTPFENKDAVAVTEAFAQTNDLSAVGDLAAVPGLRLAGREEFADLQLGLVGLREVYGLTDVVFTPVPLGDQYAALDEGTVDAVDAFTTDPQLSSGDYRLLEDPELLFGSQNVVMVVGEHKLESIDAQAFLTVVDTVNDTLDEATMIQLNAEVTAGRDEAAVATSYLRGVDLMTPLDLG